MHRHNNNINYSVYVNKRPRRIAFFVDPSNTNSKELSTIISLNQRKWGGLFNTIIETDGKRIEDDWWRFLLNIDPDVIYSFVNLDERLLSKINRFVSPYFIEIKEKSIDDADWSPGLIGDNGLAIYPTVKNISAVSKTFFDTSNLVLFELNQHLDDISKQFVNLNFGTYEHYHYLDKILDTVKKRRFEINNKSSLSNALVDLSDFGTYIYPIQLCSLPNTFKEAKNNRLNQIFTVTIGNSPRDIIFNWNRTFFLNDYIRTSFNHVWIPLEVANDISFEESLSKWLRRCADPYGSGSKGICFFSLSLNDVELKEIAERLTQKNHIPLFIKSINQQIFPEFDKVDSVHRNRDKLELYKVRGNEAYIELSNPIIPSNLLGYETWMADVYYQFPPDYYPNYLKELFWQFPKRNNTVYYIFNKPARVNAERFPSVLMTTDKPSLTIKIPDIESLFRSTICGGNIVYQNNDPRKSIIKRPFERIERSDKGKYLSGFIDNFSNLSAAYMTLESRYWRRIFSFLAGQDEDKDESSKNRLINRLKKYFRSKTIDFLKEPERIDWLADIIMDMSKEQIPLGKEKLFLFFQDNAKQELDDFNRKRDVNQKITLSDKEIEQELKEAISRFSWYNIIQLGIKPKCQRCGSYIWYHIDEVRQNMRCKGCGYDFVLPPEQMWYYKLNTLIENAYTHHGIIPVLLVLGQLLDESMTSFIMATSLNLYEQKNSKPFSDLDIICIQDGKLIIGEVKTRYSLFNANDFKKMSQIAIKLKPDMLIFSSMEQQKPKNSIMEKIKELQDLLGPEDIEVKWYALKESTFSPVHFFC